MILTVTGGLHDSMYLDTSDHVPLSKSFQTCADIEDYPRYIGDSWVNYAPSFKYQGRPIVCNADRCLELVQGTSGTMEWESFSSFVLHRDAPGYAQIDQDLWLFGKTYSTVSKK